MAFGKGFFSRVRLSVQESYPRLGHLRQPYILGAALAAVAVVGLLVGGVLGKDELLSNGPLSTSHALFGSDCTSCHTPTQGAVDMKCSNCHEKQGDQLGVYSFASHYAYRSNDPDRSAPSSAELGCAACHREHQGRDAQIFPPTDQQCTSCHEEIESFTAGHPEFDILAENIADADNLRFPHVLHVREVGAEEEIEDLELTCLYCHNGEPDGKTFKDISFEEHCGSCHLTSSTRTPPLPVRPGSGGIGVQTLAQIQDGAGAGRLWADYANPNEFQVQGNRVTKRPLYHADPWVLDNLNRLRQELYEGGGLEELLRVSADVPIDERRTLYEEAMNTLRDGIRALRDEPSQQVHDELERLEGLLATVERRLADPLTPLNDAQFRVGPGDLREGVSEEERTAYEALIGDLTAACQDCHVVENATIKRVRADQTTLTRTEFSHRAHVTHARCLDCHTAIPIREFADSDEDPEPAQDHAGIQNIPAIETCRTCHTDEQASNECTSCHVFHPDKTQWSNLLRYTHE
ncbi:MAG: cytochrome c3 family protein [Longimicrobiales bacterium]